MFGAEQQSSVKKCFESRVANILICSFLRFHGKLYIFFLNIHIDILYSISIYTAKCMHTQREREMGMWGSRYLETSLGTAWYDTSWNPCYHVINDRNGSCQVLGSRLYESGFSHGFESSARDIQTATLQKQAPRFGRKRPQTDDTGNPMDSFLPSRNTITYPTLKGSGGKMRKYF